MIDTQHRLNHYSQEMTIDQYSHSVSVRAETDKIRLE